MRLYSSQDVNLSLSASRTRMFASFRLTLTKRNSKHDYNVSYILRGFMDALSATHCSGYINLKPRKQDTTRCAAETNLLHRVRCNHHSSRFAFCYGGVLSFAFQANPIPRRIALLVAVAAHFCKKRRLG